MSSDEEENIPFDMEGGMLSQDEIDNLLAQATEQESSLIIWHDKRRSRQTETVHIEPYDFRTPIFLSEIEMRRLRLLHEDFIRYLEARMAIFLRLEISIKMSKLSTISYGQYTESMSNPTHICFFKVNPLPGLCIIDINPRLALTIASRMLGGAGQAVNADRYLTEIETDLIDEMIGIVLKEWAGNWDYDETLEPSIVGHELSGRFLQTAPHDSIVLLLALEFEVRDCLEQMQIAFPLHLVEPLVRNLQNKRRKEMDYAHGERKIAWRDSYGKINIPVTASWQTPAMKLSDWLNLEVGTVIPINRRHDGNLELELAGKGAFVAEPGIQDGQRCIRIQSKLTEPNEPNL
ncbi:MAG: FliM/FliN family flagellar motor switch protein [Opitutales bacterium]|nr:FliM/FliN family flagellar motor switch protein [Opitutales bacterium]